MLDERCVAFTDSMQGAPVGALLGVLAAVRVGDDVGNEGSIVAIGVGVAVAVILATGTAVGVTAEIIEGRGMAVVEGVMLAKTVG